MLKAVILSTTVLAAYCGSYHHQPSYYNKYGGEHDSLDRAHGGYEENKGGHMADFGGSKYATENGANGYEGGKYGSEGRKHGDSYYAKGQEHGHGDEAHEGAYKKAGDSFGGKKFSYFTSGSGPYGAYQKGYYGSDGYEHGEHKSKYNVKAEDDGFKNGYDGEGAAHDDKYTSYDKANDAHKKHGSKYDSGKFGSNYGTYGDDANENGWKNSAHKQSFGSKDEGSYSPYYN